MKMKMKIFGSGLEQHVLQHALMDKTLDNGNIYSFSGPDTILCENFFGSSKIKLNLIDVDLVTDTNILLNGKKFYYNKKKTRLNSIVYYFAQSSSPYIHWNNLLISKHKKS